MKKQTQPKPVKRPTQLDVARIAGVSRATVSYVLNGLADGKVSISQETRERVQQAIAELGYEPNAGARALRSGTTQTIGLIIPDLNNPHFWENANGVEQEARAAGYRMLLSSTDLNVQRGEDVFRDLSGRRIDALVLMWSMIYQSEAVQQILKRGLKRGLPIVEISDHPQHVYKVDCVYADYQGATQTAMTHLLGLGHRRIGLIFGAPVEWASDRLYAYQDSLRGADLSVDPALIVECGYTMDDGYQAALRLLALPDRPTAIVAINDILAMGALRAAGDLGLTVPKDFSLIGFDDIPEAKFLVPRLTTASKDAVRMGREAVRLALARLHDPTMPRQIVNIPVQFIIRESTGPAPGFTSMTDSEDS